MNLLKTTLLTTALALSIPAVAQTQLRVSTGSPSGTYSRMHKELVAMCKDQITQIEVPSSGSIQNMDRLMGNEVNAAIVQTDVLFYRARNEDLSNVKTLFSLYPEEVHIVTAKQSPIKEGGTLGYGAKPIQINDVTQLAGRTVAVWGGSAVTAQVIRLQTEIAFSVIEVNDYKAAKLALDAGQVAAILMVGGQPMADISSLPSSYKLVPFTEAIVSKLKSVYVPAKLNYGNLGLGGQGILGIATEALFVTYSYKTPKYVESLAALRTCFSSNVAEIAERTGSHMKWKTVNPENTGKWAYYGLPTTKK